MERMQVCTEFQSCQALVAEYFRNLPLRVNSLEIFLILDIVYPPNYGLSIYVWNAYWRPNSQVKRIPFQTDLPPPSLVECLFPAP